MYFFIMQWQDTVQRNYCNLLSFLLLMLCAARIYCRDFIIVPWNLTLTHVTQDVNILLDIALNKCFVCFFFFFFCYLLFCLFVCFCVCLFVVVFCFVFFLFFVVVFLLFFCFVLLFVFLFVCFWGCFVCLFFVCVFVCLFVFSAPNPFPYRKEELLY